MSSMLSLDLDRCVHLCLDMQRLFAPGAPWATPWITKVMPNVVSLCEAFAPRNVFTRFIPPERGEEMPGQWRLFYLKWRTVTRAQLPPGMLDIVSELAEFARRGVMHDKTVYSAFADGHLHGMLLSRNVDCLVISGAETDVCVLSSVLDAVDLGYRVILVKDAVCSSSDRGHDALMTMYHERFSLQIELATTEETRAACATRG